MKSMKSRAGVIFGPLLRATAAVAVLLSPALAVRAAADQASEKEGIKGIYDSLKLEDIFSPRNLGNLSLLVQEVKAGHRLKPPRASIFFRLYRIRRTSQTRT